MAWQSKISDRTISRVKANLAKLKTDFAAIEKEFNRLNDIYDQAPNVIGPQVRTLGGLMMELKEIGDSFGLE